MTKKKKIIILSIMCLLLVVTGYLNFTMLDEDTQSVGSNLDVVTTSNSFFASYRTDRQSTRDQEIEYLDAIIASSEVQTIQKESATTQKMELVARMETELALESLIKAKNYEDVIVTVSGDNYNILVKCEDNLDTSEVAQILDIVTSQTGAKATNIKIIPIS